jgi:hypothetical protein
MRTEIRLINKIKESQSQETVNTEKDTRLSTAMGNGQNNDSAQNLKVKSAQINER